MTEHRISAVYRVRSSADSIDARARTIATEQSVEMPLEAIDDPVVLAEIVGRVEAIEDRGGGLFDVTIGLVAETVGGDAGQLFNMLFGNTSLQADVALVGADIPARVAAWFGGPKHGISGLRARAEAGRRALTCSALKPQGLSSAALAVLAGRLAAGGLDFIKDDHGLADQEYAPFARRVPACAASVRRATESTGRPTHYVPSLSGSLVDMRAQMAVAREAGLDTVMLAPLVAGPANFQALVRENPDFAFLAHPSLGGAARIAPELLIGTLLPLLGADAVIFPHHGGRFGYSEATCRRLAESARHPAHGQAPSLPVPAGGISLDRVPEILDFYGPDAMLLVGGSLLLARERIAEATASFTGAVAGHFYRAEPHEHRR